MSVPVPMYGFGGGGGTSLNFDVKAYATEEALLAATPSKYTIGVITEHDITGWVFNATKPESPLSGLLFFKLSLFSDYAFNAIKKNEINLYLHGAEQYNDGAFSGVPAYIYQNGSWVEMKFWDGVLYDSGVDYSEYSGGWSTTDGDEVTMGSEYMSTSTGNIFNNFAIDVTGYKTLKFLIINDGGWVTATIGLGSSRGTYDASVTVPKGIKTFTEYSVDITNLSGKHYVGFDGGETDAEHTKVNKVWFVE